jgi:dTDP-glucose 4,6-dehydratase
MNIALDSRDLTEVFVSLDSHWELFRQKNVLITGGTGIIGKWLIANLLFADDRLSLGIHLIVLSRDPDAFRINHPAFAIDCRLRFIQGDVKNFDLPENERVDYAIHAATDVVANTAPLDTLDTCIAGTQRVLTLAKLAGARRVLFLSSGAVYGKTPQTIETIPEEYAGSVNTLSPTSAYAEGKRCAELLCSIENSANMEITIARCFAMVGPYLPLDKHFAIGNFIDSVLKNSPIVVKGDGTPVRSYLYMTNVTTRLLQILLRGHAGIAYNVGGDEAITIAELAQKVVDVLNSSVEISIANEKMNGAHSDRYVPNSDLINQHLGAIPTVSLCDSIARTAEWYRKLYRGAVLQ